MLPPHKHAKNIIVMLPPHKHAKNIIVMLPPHKHAKNIIVMLPPHKHGKNIIVMLPPHKHAKNIIVMLPPHKHAKNIIVMLATSSQTSVPLITSCRWGYQLREGVSLPRQSAPPLQNKLQVLAISFAETNQFADEPAIDERKGFCSARDSQVEIKAHGQVIVNA